MECTQGQIPLTRENFEEIYKANYSLLLQYIYVIVRNKQWAQDILSELFCELWSKRNTLSIHTSVRSYLLVSARRMASRQLAKAAETLPADYLPELADTTPQNLFIQKENTLLLDQLLDSLSPLRQDIVRLRMLGLTYTEIGEVLQITAKRVEYHLTAAIVFLREETRSRPYYRELSFILLLSPLLNEVTFW